jgi:hypothetical protein
MLSAIGPYVAFDVADMPLAAMNVGFGGKADMVDYSPPQIRLLSESEER